MTLRVNYYGFYCYSTQFHTSCNELTFFLFRRQATSLSTISAEERMRKIINVFIAVVGTIFCFQLYNRIFSEIHSRKLVAIGQKGGHLHVDSSRNNLRRPSGIDEMPSFGVKSGEARENVSLELATKICREILLYGGVRVNSDMNKECVTY